MRVWLPSLQRMKRLEPSFSSEDKRDLSFWLYSYWEQISFAKFGSFIVWKTCSY